MTFGWGQKVAKAWGFCNGVQSNARSRYIFFFRKQKASTFHAYCLLEYFSNPEYRICHFMQIGSDRDNLPHDEMVYAVFLEKRRKIV